MEALKNIENQSNTFFQEIKKIETERQRYFKMGVIDESQLGTNLVEFQTISEYITKQIFIDKYIDKEKQNYVLTIIKSMEEKCLSVFQNIPTPEELFLDGELIHDLSLIFSQEQLRMLLLYSTRLNILFDDMIAQKEHLIESHGWDLKDRLDFLEVGLLKTDAQLHSIINFFDMSVDFEEFENEIKVTLKTDPELSALLNKLENVLGDNDDN